jgi:hypothetical protein
MHLLKRRLRHSRLHRQRLDSALFSVLGFQRRLPLPKEAYLKAKFIGLFGIHCGQYYDQVEVRVGAPKRRERQGDPIHEGDKLFIQSGMTIVVPVWRITELLNLEVFETVRQERENSVADLARDRPQPESIEVPFAQPDDENP